MSFQIASNCSGCMACVVTCPTGAIRSHGGALQVIDAARCVDCGACGAACPEGAVLDATGEVFSTWELPRGKRAAIELGCCTGCEWCVEACGVDALLPIVFEGVDGESIRLVRIDEGRCTGCGWCVQACTTGAITVASRDDPRRDRWRSENGAVLRSLGARVPGEASAGVYPARD